jgi:hypothetical protein
VVGEEEKWLMIGLFFFFCSVCLADADGPIFLTSLSLTLDGSGVHASKALDMISSYAFAMQTEDI